MAAQASGSTSERAAEMQQGGLDQQAGAAPMSSQTLTTTPRSFGDESPGLPWDSPRHAEASSAGSSWEQRLRSFASRSVPACASVSAAIFEGLHVAPLCQSVRVVGETLAANMVGQVFTVVATNPLPSFGEVQLRLR